MGLFSRTKLTPEQIAAAQKEISAACDAEDYSKMYNLCRKLNKEAPGEGDYYMAMLYMNGNGGVKEDYAAVVRCCESYLSLHEKCGDAWVFGGMALALLDNWEKSIEWYQKGYECGAYWGLPLLGTSYYRYGHQLRDSIMKSLNAEKVTAFNAMACKSWRNGIKAFKEAAARVPGDMDYDHWRFMANCAEMLYSLACLGEMPRSISDAMGQTVMSYGLDVVQSKFDYDAHQRWWYEMVGVWTLMEQKGCAVMAELNRANGSLLEARYHHSAEAFYRARWHMKRAGELRRALSAAAQEEVASHFDTIANEFREMSKKYGTLTDGMMRSGKLPDISASYAPEKAPAVESCAGFMEMFDVAQRPVAAAPRQEKSGGLLGKLFGRK